MDDSGQPPVPDQQGGMLRYLTWLQEMHSNYIKPLGSAYPREQSQWAKDNPNMARFLAEGVPQAMMGVRSAPGAAIGNDAVMASRLTKAHPYETPADIHARLSRMPQGPERDAMLAEVAGFAARDKRAMETAANISKQRQYIQRLQSELYEPNEPANMNTRSKPELAWSRPTGGFSEFDPLNPWR